MLLAKYHMAQANGCLHKAKMNVRTLWTSHVHPAEVPTKRLRKKSQAQEFGQACLPQTESDEAFPCPSGGVAQQTGIYLQRGERQQQVVTSSALIYEGLPLERNLLIGIRAPVVLVQCWCATNKRLRELWRLPSLESRLNIHLHRPVHVKLNLLLEMVL
jgi:hypothetical protein